MTVAQVNEVVARDAAVQLREPLGDQLAFFLPDPVQHAQHMADAVRAPLGGGQLQRTQRSRDPLCAVHEHRAQFLYVVARLAVEHRALARGVRGDHAADGGAVRRRKFGGEEEPMLRHRIVELVLHHAGLHASPALLCIDLEDGVHVARQVHAQAVGE